MDEKYNQIVKFSGLGEFIDVPIKNYSSGMRSKLGFAIATIAEPEILILDEVLSVGDRKFRRKSERRILKMMENGTAVLFVSHSLAQVQRICNKAMILDHGQMIAFGDVDEIAELYTQMTEEPDEANSTRGGEDELAVTEKTGTKAEKTKAEKTDNVTAE